MKGDFGGNLHAAPPVVGLKRQRSGRGMVAPKRAPIQWTFCQIVDPVICQIGHKHR
jgi:hypothetical protein